MCVDFKSAKRWVRKEKEELFLKRQVDVIFNLGEDANKFNIIDRREMTHELVQQFILALNPNSPSIKSVIPSGEKIRIRVGPSAQAGYEIRYSYDLRSGISGPKLLPDNRSRDFCQNYIRANKLYTRAEIERMKNAFGTDPFIYAGGWYHNPETGETTPYCRHSWYENLVIKK